MQISFERRFEITQTKTYLALGSAWWSVLKLFHFRAEFVCWQHSPLLVEAYSEPILYSLNHFRGYFGAVFGEFKFLIILWLTPSNFRFSCNDIKLRGLRAGNKYDDGFQMIRVNSTQYLPVYCDMTTSDGAFTLLVTSANNNWTRAQVPRR